jgi:hypothetical protein
MFLDDEQEARATLLQYFGALAQHWAIIVAGYGVVLFSILQFKSFFVSKGLFEVALFGLFGQAVFAASRFILHGWYCEQAVEGTLGSKDWGATLTLLGRVHASMLRQIHEKHECIMKLPPFWGKRAGWGWVVWTLVWTIPPFIVYTCGRHSTEFCGFLQRFFLGCAV